MGCPQSNELYEIKQRARYISNRYDDISYVEAESLMIRDFMIYNEIRNPDDVVELYLLKGYTEQQQKHIDDYKTRKRKTFEERALKLEKDKRYEASLRKPYIPFKVQDGKIGTYGDVDVDGTMLRNYELQYGGQARDLSKEEMYYLIPMIDKEFIDDRTTFESVNYYNICSFIEILNEKFGANLSLLPKLTNNPRERFRIRCGNPALIKLIHLCSTFQISNVDFPRMNKATIDSLYEMLDTYEGKQYEMWNVFLKNDLNEFWEESIYYSTTRPAEKIQNPVTQKEEIIPVQMDEYEWDSPTAGVHTEKEIDEALRNEEEVKYYKDKCRHLSEDTLSVPGNLNYVVTDDGRTRESKKIASELCKAFGVDYEFISEEEAYALTKSYKNKYDGQASGFFLNGKAYFIEGKVTKNTIFHEFCHPLMRHIRNTNRTLFDNLYFSLQNSPFGQEIIQSVRANYDEDYDFDSDEFKEECLVFALGKEINSLDDESRNVLQKIWYAIKRALRSLFGSRIDLSKLSVNTTLSDFAEMIDARSKFNIQEISTTNDDIIAYMKDLTNEKIAIENELNETQILPRINKLFIAMKEYVNRIESNEDLDTLKQYELDFFGKSDVYDALRCLNISSDVYESSRIKNAADLYQRRVTALAKTLVVLQRISNDIKLASITASKKPMTQDTCQEIYQLNRIIDYWKREITEFRDEMAKENITITEISKLLDTTETRLRESKSYIDDAFLKISTDTIYGTLEPFYDNMRSIFSERLRTIQNNGNIKKYIDDLYTEYYGMNESQYMRYIELSNKLSNGNVTTDEQNEYNNLKRKLGDGLIKSKDDIRSILLGQMGDTNYLNAKLEGYMYSKDPIVGGFAMYFKQFTTNALTNALDGYAAMFKEISPLLDRIGYNKNNIGMLGRKFLFKDLVFTRKRREGGSDSNTDRSLSEATQTEVWTFLNPFKNWRFELQTLENNVNEARTEQKLHPNEENEKRYLEAKQRLDEFNMKWMHQEYVPEYYEALYKLKYSEIGKKAIERRNEIFERLDLALSIIESGEYNEDDMNNYDQCITELRNLSSIYDLNGNIKDAEGIEIARVLSEYNSEIGKYKRSITDGDRFNRDYKEMIERARIRFTDAAGILDSDGYAKYIDEWVTRNCRYDETDEFKVMVQDALRKIMECSVSNEDAELKELWQEIFDRTKGLKDAYGVYMVDDMSEDTKSRIKELQELIEKRKIERKNELTRLRTELHKKGLSPEKRREIVSKIKSLQAPSALISLIEHYNSLIIRVPNQFYVDMFNTQLERFDATDNTLTDFRETFGFDEVTINNANSLYDHPKFVSFLMKHGYDVNAPENSTGFGKWFYDNHVKSEFEKKDSVTNQKYTEYRFRRAYYYDVKRPVDDQYIKKHVVRDPETGIILTTLNGTPGMRYTKSVVKDEYKTPKNSDTQDNRGNWLPRNVSDSPFRNEEYYKLTSDERAVIDCMVRHHLKAQEESSYGARLYLDAPRFRKDSVEFMMDTAKAFGKNSMNMLIHRWKMFVNGGADDFENGVSNAQLNLVYLDVLEDDFSQIPVSGKYALDAEDVSMNILRSMERYTISLEKEKALRRMSPVASAIMEVLKGHNVESDLVNKKSYIEKAIIKYIPKKENVRRDAVQSLIDREFKGETLKGFGKNSILLQNVSNLLFGAASKSFFMMNIPSALKNSYGIKFQIWLESSSGRYVTPSTLLKANHWSNDLMFELAFGGHYDIHKMKSMKHQIMEYFDMYQDNTAETMMDPLWRSVGTDIMEGKFLMMPRKWLEQQATVQVGAAMLFKHHIQHRRSDGTIEEIPYMEAFETDSEGRLQFRKDFDISYDIHKNLYHVEQNDTIESIAERFNTSTDYIKRMMKGRTVDDFIMRDAELTQEYNNALYLASRESDPTVKANKIAEIEAKYIHDIQDNYLVLENTGFISFRNKIHQVNNDLGGSYAKFDQPDAHRTMLYKFIFFLKRYLTNMFLKRYRLKSSFNPGFGEVERGYYISTLHWAKEMVKSCGKYYKIAPSSEKKAIAMFLTEIGMLALLPLIAKIVFGYDPDDEDKFKKLRAKSGSLPTFLNREDTDREFDALGWLELHTLHVILQVRQENEQFNPIAGGLNQMNQFLDIKSVVFSPTIDLLTQSITDLINISLDDPAAYYTRDVGPYQWQDKESAKVWNHTLRLFGLTGTSVDPALAIQNFQANANKIRR